MKTRCLNKNIIRYKDYGGRGITICEEWLTFSNFKKWALDNGYKETLSLDRINNDGNYEPDNCRWATRIEQQRNTSTNRIFTYMGESHCVSEWGEILGVNWRDALKILKQADSTGEN